VTTALQRTVLVLGSRAIEAPRLYPDDVDGSMTLVVIAVGWPLTAAQQQAVEAARGLAREHSIVFDAQLVGSLAEASEIVSARDRVLLATDRREARRVTRLLRPRGISARVAR
jgi:NAD(P)H-hydrate repair Nnr-like enzyme with NAD(P)H-hydrate dehydratase domain